MGVRSLRGSLLFSVFAHLCFLLLLWICLVNQQATQPPSKKLTWIEVEPTKKLEKKTDENRNHRMVQTSPAERVDKPKDNSFLGKQNQTVDRETVNRNKTTVMGSSEHHSSGPDKSKKDLSRLGLAILPEKAQVETDQPQWATPGTRPQDYIKGMKESDLTALNTQEYLFYGYFQRIRERLDHAWVPILREKLMAYYRSGRQLASDTDHVTKVLVVLNEKGEIVRVKLLGESGTRDLDDAAVGAFNQAGPFPNPPKGIVDHNREVQIPWDFILKT